MAGEPLSPDLDRIVAGRPTAADITGMLQAKGDLQQALFRVARHVRQQMQHDRVRLRGVIEFSNICQKRCCYCAMACTNKPLERYRMSPLEIITAARAIADAGIGTLLLQSGQDPHADAILEEVLPVIAGDVGLDIILCVGEKTAAQYQRYAELGASSYILKFETSSPGLYKAIADADLNDRLRCLEWVRAAGLKIGTGNIVGLPGQSLDSLAEDVLLTHRLRPDFASSAPFVPNDGTPLKDEPAGDLDITLNTIALYRILLRDCLVPSISALEKLQPGGQLRGLQAGANVMTVNFTPAARREKFTIYSNNRFVVDYEHAIRTIRQAGLTIKNPFAADRVVQ